MKINAISVSHNYSKVKNQNKTVKNSTNSISYEKPTFKGTKGGVIGIFTGAAAGAGLALLTIATGGLAGVVAAVGATATVVGGAAAGTHIGGIAGSIIEDSIDNKEKK